MLAGSSPTGLRGGSKTPGGPASLPGPLAGATLVEAATLHEVPNAEALAAWLEARGVPTSGWGEGCTKSVAKLWKELKLGEAALEVWRGCRADELKVLRATHVLRGKVCSSESYERRVFLFNTWQQFGDGRKRTRNGLLSEKLSTSEVPLEAHLHEVCQRAVEEEEMQRLVEGAFSIGPGNPAPEFDPSYRCPLRVESEHFVDYTIEVEESKSFPGLLTAYHLYTVDIVCSGLPGVDFNTLEFEEPDEKGVRRLKYVHAWNWLDWPMIKRYLFEGSTLKETKRRGCFDGEEALADWLEQLGVDTALWGTDGFKSVVDLLNEVDKEEAQLELWGRHDGAPLLMRVVHVLQLKVVSDDPRLADKFLLQTWQQSKDGRARSINRIMSKKLSCATVPFDEVRFAEVAKQVLHTQLSVLADVHFELNPAKLPKPQDFAASEVEISSTRFSGHHFDIEESPSFKGMQTMYHLYTMEVECAGLPLADFTSLDFGRAGGPCAIGWRWITLPGCLDVLHGRAQALEREGAKRRRALAETRRGLAAGSEATSRSLASLRRLAADSSPSAARGEDLRRLTADLEEAAHGLRKAAAEALLEEERAAKGVPRSAAETLPPAMLSKMASDLITSETLLEEAMHRQSSDAARDAPGGGRTERMRRDSQKSRLRDLLEEDRRLTAEWASAARPRRWALGLALGLCAAQAALGSAALVRARAAGSPTFLASSCVLGAFGIAFLVATEAFAERTVSDGF